MKRLHSLESSMTSQSPDRRDSADQIGYGAPLEISSPTSENCDSEMYGLTSSPPSQGSTKLDLAAKLQEFRDAKVAAIAEVSAKFDKDIEALERVLSFT